MSKKVFFFSLLLFSCSAVAQTEFMAHINYLLLTDDTDSKSESPPRPPLRDLISDIFFTINSNTLGTNAESDRELYIVRNPDSDIFTRNPSVWTNDFAQSLTCVSSFNDPTGTSRDGLHVGTLITPRHVIAAAHTHMANGDVMSFVDVDNNVYERTVLTSYTVSVDLSVNLQQRPDVSVAVLDEELPAEITPCLVPPANFDDYFIDPTSLSQGNIYPLLSLRVSNQQEAVVQLVSAVNGRGNGINIVTPFSGGNTPQSLAEYPHISQYCRPIYGPESGKPFILLIEGRSVVLSVLRNAFASTGIHHFIDEINAVIRKVDSRLDADTGYVVNTVNLSNFKRY